MRNKHFFSLFLFQQSLKFVQMNISSVEAADLLLPRDNLSLAMAGNEEVTLRLTNYLVPAAFGLILTLGVLGNFMVIGVVSFVNLISVNSFCL